MTSTCYDLAVPVDRGAGRCGEAACSAQACPAPAQRTARAGTKGFYLYRRNRRGADSAAVRGPPPTYPTRLRGAWGRRLETIAANETGRLFGSPSAWEIFFGPPIGAPELDPVRPFVIRVDRRNYTLLVTLRLFGFADCWLAEAATALHRALESGIAIRQYGRHRVPLAVQDITIQRNWGISVTPELQRLKIRLEEPLVLRFGRSRSPGLQRLVGAMERRLSALCRWQDMALQLKVSERPDALPKVVAESLVHVRWTRFSVRQRVGQPMHALTGEAVLDDLPNDASMLVQAAACVHAGSSCASGLGRVSIFTS
jgi:hypothetical protein